MIEFCPPIRTASLGREAAMDPMTLFDLTDQVRDTIQQTVWNLLARRGDLRLITNTPRSLPKPERSG